MIKSLFLRVLGALLSAHLIITDPLQPFGDMRMDDYQDELLHLSHDLASRLLPAFEDTMTGIPYPRVRILHLISFFVSNNSRFFFICFNENIEMFTHFIIFFFFLH